MPDLFDHSADEAPPLPGYRLSKLEIYNWGTFDRAVYSVCPRGQTTLLVGENGSGKSTLVDALLTLLVRPQTRNYNVAAGAMKNERDDRTYIRGAYDRTIGESGRPQIQYLRSGAGHYTALLACFSNAATRSAFTICQVLYLTSDNSVERVYAYSDGERGIVEDISNINSASGVARHMRDRGFQTTASYKQYASWIQRKTSFRAKAMDIFNQTVAVKDVQRLDLFIRQHMLESKPWKEKVDRLLNHFSELSEAHRTLMRVRQQSELLLPINEAGHRYLDQVEQKLAAKRRLDACELYFSVQTLALLEPLCDKWRTQIDFLSGEIHRLDTLQDQRRDEIARLNIEIENAGGQRLRQLPGLIAQAEELARVKLESRTRFESQLRSAGMQPRITSPEQFHKSRELMHQRRAKMILERTVNRKLSNKIQFEIGSREKQLSDDRRELEALLKRKNNLPESLMSMRDMLCRDLKLAPSDLPYAAELVAVAPAERDWESSVEQVLHGFARSLLVPQDVYARVSGYVDSTRLLDNRGQGQRLVYLKVGRPAENLNKLKTRGDSLVDKLQYREDHPLAAWVRAEIAARFDYQACDSVEAFQRAKGAAMTQNRHLKSGSYKHSKDDRSSPDDRRHFVLGWDNREKRQALADAIRDAEEALKQLTTRDETIVAEVDRVTAAIADLDQALAVEDFDTIDFEKHEFDASQMQLEKQRLEESNDQIQELKASRKRLEAEVSGYKADRDRNIAERTLKENELRSGNGLLANARRLVDQIDTSGRRQEMEAEFETLETELKPKLTIENLAVLPQESAKKLRERFEKLQDRLVPIARDVTSAMTRFLRKFPDEQTDLDADVDSLSSFQALYERIAVDDLPKHEARFKKRLNEKVLHEVGLLHGSLENDRQEIRDKIEQLNTALRLLEWKPGTFMRLEPSDVTDREIQDFRRELAGCLSGTLDGTAEANETTFLRIEKLVEKFRDEGSDRWRQKVIDVRNWFNFAAREFVAETNESRSYYDGGTGQSGGEKGKLAFLVLVAAIAYQYDLDPDAKSSDRFHFVMVDEMFSRSDDQHAEYALDLFDRFGLQLLIVAPLDAKARVTEPYVGTYIHVVKDKTTHCSELLSITAEELNEQARS
ncbi:MAG: ATP-binding protein [Pirellulaceae bacterium]